MKWLLWIGGGLIGLVGVVAMIGATLPVRHSAERKARFQAAPETVWAVLSGPPDWRPEVKSFGTLPQQDAHQRWWEQDARGRKINYELVEERAPSRRVTRIGPGLPFGGTWTFEVTPAGNGSEVRIHEDGEVYNVIFRFVSRFILGHHATIEGYLRDLGAKLGETVRTEA